MIRINTNNVHYHILCLFKVCHPTQFGEISPPSGIIQSFIKIIKYDKYQIQNFTKNTGYKYYTKIVNYV
jgi:hypothetical protein